MGLSLRRFAAIIVVPVVLIAIAVFTTATLQRDGALDAAHRQATSQQLLTTMLDEETGARGYFETRDSRFLDPFYTGEFAFARALAASRALDRGDAPLLQALTAQAQQNATWRAVITDQITTLADQGTRPSVAQALAGRSMVDNFRRLNAIYAVQLGYRRDRALTRSTWLGVGVTGLVCVLLVLCGLWLVRRLGRREAQRLRRQQELRELLQVSASEDESRDLLIRHVERSVPRSAAAVLNRNNSDDRLEVVINKSASPSAALRGLPADQLRPRSCLAVRLSRTYRSEPGDTPLLECEVCGKIGTSILCEPLLVGGQVIGSVLIASEASIDHEQADRLRESVTQAAPILANQRNLALAERRAASDALTGLPNRRAADESIKRMTAHAGRTITPLSAVLLDLDHFKQINDLHGHDRGDKVLAAVGGLLAANVRASDFAARFGGEEFLLLLPDTDRDGALELAEKLRRSIERADIGQIGRITASFGVATLPMDAVEPEQLLRKADRALYAAKARGRNRVEVAVSSPASEGHDVQGPGPAGADPLDA
ncbi:MAG TPA: diguanylate cyclase [Solirubrobacteraceae bacterium]|nr:diguanylate cyclase [Solirubrobacteraceae bacterium]